MLHPGLRMSSAAIFAVAVSWSAIGTAEAETAGNSKSCLSGSIAPFDYALLDEDFHNLSWTGQSGVQVNSGTKTLTLTVTDSYGNSLCQNVGNSATSCTFVSGVASTFTIRIDNTQNSMQSGLLSVSILKLFYESDADYRSLAATGFTNRDYP